MCTCVCNVLIPKTLNLKIQQSKCRDVEIFFGMPVIWTNFENLVSPNNKICSRNIKICTQNFAKEERERIREIFQHGIHGNDIFLIEKVSIIIIAVLKIPRPRDLRLFYGNSLAAIDGTIQENALSSLPLFAIKLLYLLTNIEVLNCSSRENKSWYKHLKYLVTNVFGYDIATSKL